MQRQLAKPVQEHPRPLVRQSLAQLVARWRRRRIREKAFERAYLEFQATHLHCAELCFDRHFLLTKGAEALSRRDAKALAHAWTTQFRYRDESQRPRDVRQLVPLAESFVELLGFWEQQSDLH